MKTLIFVFCISILSLQVDAAICGRISSMRGQIEVLRLKSDRLAAANQPRTGVIATKRMKLWCSDIILTRKAARAKIRLKNNTVMTMGPHSRIEIENYLSKSKSVNRLKLTYGKVRALFEPGKKEMPTELPVKGATKKKLKSSSLIIKTPSAVAGVRGTDFYLSYNPDKALTEQATISGEVEVSNEVTGQKVNVKPGRQIKVDKIQDDVAKKIKAKLKGGQALTAIQEELGINAEMGQPVPIANYIKSDIRQTSANVRNDKSFATRDAVALLGKAQEWKVPADELPLDYKDLKEEF